MSKSRSPLDRAAELLSARAESISKGRVGTQSLSEISVCLEEEIIGAYPQASPLNTNGGFIDDGYLYLDRFPEPISDPIELCLQNRAQWTDVLSASSQYRCFLVNSEALKIFKQFELGNVRFYNAVVTGKNNEKIDYTFIFLCNHVTLDDIDFAHSECHLVDMLSEPIREIDITDKEVFLAKDRQAEDGSLPESEPFCRIELGKIQLLSGHAPQSDIFGLGQLDTRIFCSTSLRDALLDADISGLEFKQNTRLFFGQ